MENGAEPGTAPAVADWRARLVMLWTRAQETWKRLPSRTRFLLAVGCAVFVLAGLYAYLSGGGATMNLVVRHPFRTAKMQVRLDGSEVYSDEIGGSAAKKYFLFGKTGGTHSTAIAVRSGKHDVEVEISAGGFHQVQSTSATFTRERQTTVTASVERGELFVTARGGTAAGESGRPATSFVSLASPLLLTICGSALSAVIGFFVQEFLRARRTAAKPAQVQVPTSQS